MVVLDFQGINFATQSFIHACIYKVLRDSVNVRSALSIANCSPSTREALLAVAAYAPVPEEHLDPPKGAGSRRAKSSPFPTVSWHGGA